MTYVSVVDEKKRPISPMSLGVHLQYESAYEIQGIKPKDSIVKFGEDINESEIVSRVSKEGAKFRFIREFDIEISKVGVRDNRTRILKQVRIKIKNPGYSNSAKIEESVFLPDKFARRDFNPKLNPFMREKFE